MTWKSINFNSTNSSSDQLWKIPAWAISWYVVMRKFLYAVQETMTISPSFRGEWVSFWRCWKAPTNVNSTKQRRLINLLGSPRNNNHDDIEVFLHSSLDEVFVTATRNVKAANFTLNTVQSQAKHGREMKKALFVKVEVLQQEWQWYLREVLGFDMVSFDVVQNYYFYCGSSVNREQVSRSQEISSLYFSWLTF